MSKTKTVAQEIFIKKFIEKFGSNFDFSKVEYNGSRKNIEIGCPKHGPIIATPQHFFQTMFGCKRCGIEYKGENLRKTTEEFIKDAEKVHGEKYRYELVEYIDALTKVRIICMACKDDFFQNPSYHTNDKDGCVKCTSSVSDASKKWLQDLQIEREVSLPKFVNEKRRRRVDGYDENTNTIYQYHGTWWHGHPDYCNPNDLHPVIKKPFGLLYEDTLKRDQNIRDSGYNLVIMWEHNFDERFSKKKIIK